MSFEKALLRAAHQPKGSYARTILVCRPEVSLRHSDVNRETAAAISTVLKKAGGETFHHAIGFDKKNDVYLVDTVLPDRTDTPALQRTVETLDSALFSADTVPFLELSHARQSTEELLRDHLAGYALQGMMENPNTDVTTEAKRLYEQHHEAILDLEANRFLISLR